MGWQNQVDGSIETDVYACSEQSAFEGFDKE